MQHIYCYGNMSKSTLGAVAARVLVSEMEGLVRAGPFYFVDHEDVSRCLRGLQLQSELLLHCSDEARRRVGCSRGRFVSRPLQLKVIAALQSGLVHDGAIC